MIEAIVSYIAQGIAEGEIASIVGCSASYVSQVKSREDYTLMLEKAQAKVELSREETAREKKYSKLEDKLIHTLDEQMPFAEFGHLTKLMETLIKRKQAANPKLMVTNNDNRVQTVILNIPQVAAPEIRLNTRKEVIGIGDQSMAPMTSSGVRSIFQIIEEKRKQAEKIKRQPTTLDMSDL